MTGQLNLIILVGLLGLAAFTVGTSVRRKRYRDRQRQTLLEALTANQVSGDAPAAAGQTQLAHEPEQLARLLELLEADSRRRHAVLNALSPRRAWEAGARVGERLARRTDEPR